MIRRLGRAGIAQMVDDDVIRKGKIELSIDGRVEFGAFLSDAKLLGKTTILANSPNTLWFDNQTGNAPRGVEKVTQDHPFIRFVSAKQKTGPIYFPTSALELTKTKAPDVAPGTYVFHIMRWAFAGPRDVEKLVYEARCLETGEVLDEDKAESLVNAAALDGFDWHAGA